MVNGRLEKDDWLRAARTALLHGGLGAIRVEKLARDLKVTKGSFYWHFKDREEILEALLLEWEEETRLLTTAFEKASLRQALHDIFNELNQRVVLSEKGESPSDAAIWVWASTSAKVARRVNKVEQQRIDLLARLTGRPEQAEFVYLAYLGFLLRRRRVPEAAKSFPLLAALSLKLLLPGTRRHENELKKLRHGRKREKSAMALHTR